MTDSDRDHPGLGRRDFLKLGAAGMAATISACSTTRGTMPGAAPAAAPGSGIPEVGDLADPLQAQSEGWQEPWTWRPEQWPGTPLDLNVVRAQNPGLATSPGNPAPSLFSYNGTSPGPTIRVRAGDELRIRIRNTLGPNEADTIVGPAADAFDVTPAMRKAICRMAAEDRAEPGIGDDCAAFTFPAQVEKFTKPVLVKGWAINRHVNGIHCSHTTNLHTHGLHVFPQTNPDGSHSDDVHLRILPNADLQARRESGDPDLAELHHGEHAGQLDYRYRLWVDRDGRRVPHPPGTHWYHPHAHGSTHEQVASGMAGFLVVEGDVDQAINEAMTGKPWPDPELKSGPWDYRERLVMIQRVQVGPADHDAGHEREHLRFPPLSATNGIPQPGLIRMRPGAVERWRVLNGSVDGAGTLRFMVLDGQYVQRDNRIWRVVPEGEGDARKRRLVAVSEQDFEDARLDIQQLSFDGMTLVSEVGGRAVHRIRDLSKLGRGTTNPFAEGPREGEDHYQARLRALESVYRNGDTLRRSYIRPNEVYLTNANRTDLFFKAPLDSAGRVFTIFAKEAHIQTDNHQRFLQARIRNPQAGARRELFDIVVGYVHVDGRPVEGGDFDIQSLNGRLPPVPPLLQPIHASELGVPAAEAAVTGVAPGSRRCRTISYSGIGGADFPLVEVPAEFAAAHPELENRVWAENDGKRVLLPSGTHTMAINTEFDLRANPEPRAPRKFKPHDEADSRMLVDTAEEWVLYNNSAMLWSHTDLERYPQRGSWGAHFTGYPLSRAEGQRRFHADPEFMISSKANDHPFHIHINPMWVLRIDVPDENGELHNVLPEPMWMDTVAIPRQGGRVVFRSRFEDFTGDWVNHCHVLLHEDMGMMQQVHCVDDPARANYQTRSRSAEHGMSGAEVDAIYPRPSLELMYLQNMSYVEPNSLGYHVFPGFPIEVPVEAG